MNRKLIHTISKINIRKGAPSRTAPIITVVQKGSIITSIALVEGEKIEGNNKWHQDPLGNFFWSGGTDDVIVSTPTVENQIPGLFDYNKLLDSIPDKWRITKGAGIKIALLDTGIALDHPDLSHIVQKDICTDVTRSTLGAMDIDGHGTHCLGLLGAKAKNPSRGISGIANESQFLICKIKQDKKGFFAEYLAHGLDIAIQQKVDIVNMSFAITQSTDSEVLKKIDDANKAGIILVASAGDNSNLTGDTFFYPAMYENVIAVGAIDENFMRANPNTFNHKLDFMLPHAYLWSCSLKNLSFYKTERGSSMATAIVTGIIALLLASNEKKGKTKKAIIEQLQQISKSSDNYPPPFNPYALIYPKKG